MNEVAVIDTSTFRNFYVMNRFDLFTKLKYYLFITIYVEIEIKSFKGDMLDFFEKLIAEEKIKKVELSIEDLIEMTKVPESKKYSDTELSCIVKAKQLQATALTDDKRAVNFIRNYIDAIIKGTKEILVDAYLEEILSDGDLDDLQQILSMNKFLIKDNLKYIAAEKKAKLATKR